MNKLQPLNPKQNQKQIAHESSKLCIHLKLEKKPLEVLKRIKTILSKF